MSQDSRNSGELLWHKIFQTWLNFKKKRLPKLANINQWNCELWANNEILLAKKRQWTRFSSILLKHSCTNFAEVIQKLPAKLRSKNWNLPFEYLGLCNHQKFWWVQRGIKVLVRKFRLTVRKNSVGDLFGVLQNLVLPTKPGSPFRIISKNWTDSERAKACYETKTSHEWPESAPPVRPKIPRALVVFRKNFCTKEKRVITRFSASIFAQCWNHMNSLTSQEWLESAPSVWVKILIERNWLWCYKNRILVYFGYKRKQNYTVVWTCDLLLRSLFVVLTGPYKL